MAFAFEQAEARGANLDVVNCWPLEGGHGAASAVDAVSRPFAIGPAHRLMVDQALVDSVRKYPGVHVRRSVVHGYAAPVLLGRCDSAELLVVGSRGRGGFAALLLGSVSHALLQTAPCPVAVVRGPH